jgi:chromosome segregation ATPase
VPMSRCLKGHPSRRDGRWRKGAMGSERRRELEEAQAELDGLRAELSDARRQIEEMAQRIDELAAVPADPSTLGASSDASVLARRVAKLESRLMATTAHELDEERDPLAMGSQVSALQESLDAAAEREVSLLERVHRADSIVADAGLRLTAMAGDVEGAEARAADLEQRLDDEQHARARSEDELAEGSVREDQVREALAVAELERDGARGELDRQMGEIAELSSQLEQRDASSAQLRRELDVAETARIAAEEALRDGGELIARLESDARALSQSKESLLADLESARGAMRGAEETNATLELDLAEAEAASVATHEALGRTSEQLVEATASREHLSAELDQERSNGQALGSELERVRAELEASSTAMADMKRDLARAMKEIADAEDAQGELRARVTSAEARAAQAREAASLAETNAAAADGRVTAAEGRAIEAERLLVELDGRLQKNQAILEEALHRADESPHETGAGSPDVEERVAEALEAAKTANDAAGAARADLTRAEEVLESVRDREAEQRTRAEGLLAELDEAHGRLRALEEAAGEHTTDPSPSSIDRGPTSTEIADLQRLLESAETRSRRAYAAAESAEAALRFAKERGGSVPSDPYYEEENVRLRERIAELTDRLADLGVSGSGTEPAASIGEPPDRA